MRIVIAGGGFGGLSAALTLAKLFHMPQQKDHEIVLVSQREYFLFRPSLIWAAFGQRQLDQITFPLRPALEKSGVSFLHDAIKKVKPDQRSILLESGQELSYDYLIIATGALPDWENVPGDVSNVVSIYFEKDTLSAYEKINALQNKQSIVAAVYNNHVMPAIAYEFIFELDEYLKKRNIQVSLTFCTSEQKLLERAGEKTTEIIEKHMQEKNIAYYCNTEIKRMKKNVILFDNGMEFSCDWSFVIPPYKGADFIAQTKQFKQSNGLIHVNDYLQVDGFDHIYCIGDAALPNESAFKNGRTAKMEGEYAAKTIFKQIQGQPYEDEKFQSHLLAIWELGSDGAVMSFKYPLPEGTAEFAVEGRIPHLFKTAFEKYFVWKNS